MKKIIVIVVLLSFCAVWALETDQLRVSPMPPDNTGLLRALGAPDPTPGLLSEVWVDPLNGDDSYAGTEVAPLATILSAFGAVADGTEGSPSVINLKAGTYDENLMITNREYVSIIGASKTSVFFIPTTRNAEARLFTFKQCDDIHLENIDFDFDHIKGDYRMFRYEDSSGGAVNCNFANLGISTGVSETVFNFTSMTYTDEHIGVDATFTDNGFNADNRAECYVLDSYFVDTGRLGVNAHGWVHVTIDNCVFRRTWDDFGYAFDIGSVANATVTDNDIQGYVVYATDGSTSACFIAGNWYSNMITEDVDVEYVVEGNECYFASQGIYIGNTCYWNDNIGSVHTVAYINNNVCHDNFSYGMIVQVGNQLSGSTVTAYTNNNTIINNGSVGLGAYTYGDGVLSVYSRFDKIDHNNYGVNTFEGSLYGWNSYNGTDPSTFGTGVVTTDMKFANLNGSIENGIIYGFDDVAGIANAPYCYWGNSGVEVIDGNLGSFVDGPKVTAGRIRRYAKIADGTATDFGPVGADVNVTLTGAGAANYVELYQCGSINNSVVATDDFGTTGCNVRSPLVLGIVETGTVTATLVFDATGITEFDTYSAPNMKLLKRTWDTTAWTAWEDASASINGEEFTLTSVADFAEYTIGASNLAPEITEDETVVYPGTVEFSFGWGDTGADSYNVYSSPDPFAVAADWTFVEEIFTASYTGSAANLYYRVVPVVGGRVLGDDPSAVVGGVSYACEANVGSTNINVIAVPVTPYDATPGTPLMASDLGNNIGTDNVITISKWDIYTQSWITASYLAGYGWGGDFEIEVGGSYMVGVVDDCNIVIAGVRADPESGYLITSEYTNANFVMLPLDKYDIDTFEELSIDVDGGDHIVNVISYWNNLTQSWTSKTWSGTEWLGNDFDIEIGMPYMFFTTEYVAWPTVE